jgi:hypothetical protein
MIPARPSRLSPRDAYVPRPAKHAPAIHAWCIPTATPVIQTYVRPTFVQHAPGRCNTRPFGAGPFTATTPSFVPHASPELVQHAPGRCNTRPFGAGPSGAVTRPKCGWNASLATIVLRIPGLSVRRRPAKRARIEGTPGAPWRAVALANVAPVDARPKSVPYRKDVQTMNDEELLAVWDAYTPRRRGVVRATPEPALSSGDMGLPEIRSCTCMHASCETCSLASYTSTYFMAAARRLETGTWRPALPHGWPASADDILL